MRRLDGLFLGCVAYLFACLSSAAPAPAGRKAVPLRVAVTDPLAARLACACVPGHAQRRYERLAERLQARLQRPVHMVYAERLGGALRESGGTVDLVIGKRGATEHDAVKAGVALSPLAMLTDRTGSTNLTGLFVVRAKSSYRALSDLKGRRILLGPVYAEEKHAAALAAMEAAGAAKGVITSTRLSCTVAAADLAAGKADAAVISSYALALAEGCGAVRKGVLRVIGRTAPVPFVTVFAAESLPETDRRAVRETLLALCSDAPLKKVLETRDGFVPVPGPGWPDWRGPLRDGVSADLPARLPARLRILWKRPLSGSGIGGVAATSTRVVLADKDPERARDIFRCLSADTGEPLWKVEVPAAGRLEMTNAARATPVLCGDRVYLLSAFGRLLCVRLDNGRVVWQRDLAVEFGAKPPRWGMCATPLVEDCIIVNPGGVKAGLAALDRHTGRTLWTAPTDGAAYASFIAGEFGGVRQVVGYDATTLGGWDLRTGARLWTLPPAKKGDYNVPTPVNVEGNLFVTGENNGARLYGFDAQGRILPSPLLENRDFAPDSSSPVVLDGLAFGGRTDLRCMDLGNGGKTGWRRQESAYDGYFSMIAGNGRVLILSVPGALTLIEATAQGYRPVGRMQLPGGGEAYWSHPALVGDRLYVRGSSVVYAVLLR